MISGKRHFGALGFVIITIGGLSGGARNPKLPSEHYWAIWAFYEYLLVILFPIQKDQYYDRTLLSTFSPPTTPMGWGRRGLMGLWGVSGSLGSLELCPRVSDRVYPVVVRVPACRR